ncbi:peptidoglycan DD-metalloendopeptidase family protein [Streptomyces sp. NPDC002851]
MCRSARRPLTAPVVLCVLVALLVGVRGPTDALGGAPAAEGPESTSAEVARLYEEAAKATERYEAGRRAAERQRAKAERLEELLDQKRHELRLLHDDLGRIARSQYRTGGDVSYTAQLLLAEDPEALMRSQRLSWQADLAMNNAIASSQRAERALNAGKERAKAAWQSLQARQADLAELKRGIEQKLEQARATLEQEAEQQVTAGACRGAARLDQPEPFAYEPWVAPVETYQLSAGFGGSGEHWANRHTGQDFAVDIGTPVRAVGEGRVEQVKCGAGFGMEVLIKHSDGYYTQYAHLASVTVDQGERVRTGQWLGQAGSTGNSTGPHLHFEARVTPHLGSAVDPVAWLAERGVPVGS